jgi:hypothetical protein
MSLDAGAHHRIRAMWGHWYAGQQLRLALLHGLAAWLPLATHFCWRGQA